MTRCQKLFLFVTVVLTFAASAHTAKIPKMRWSEDKDNVFVRVLIKNAKNEKITITDDHFAVDAEDASGEKYAVSFEIREDVQASQSKWRVAGSEIYVHLIKAHSHFWDRLVSDPKPFKKLLIKDYGHIHGNVGMSNMVVGDTDDVEDEVEKVKGVKLIKSEKEFSDVLSKSEIVVADFHFPWCNDCDEMKECWGKTVKKMKKDATFISVDAREMRALGKRFQVACNSTCTYAVFKRDEPDTYFLQRRSKLSEQVSDLKPYVGPSIKPLKPDGVAKFAAKPKVAVVGVFTSTSDAEYIAYRQASWTDLRKEISFGAVISQSDPFVGSAPSLKIKRKFDVEIDGGEALYGGGWDNKSLVEWLQAEKQPILSEWTFDRKKEMEDAKVAMGQLFIDVSAEYEEKNQTLEAAAKPIKTMVSKVAHSFKGKAIQFVFCSIDQLSYMLEDVGLPKEKPNPPKPLFAVDDFRTGKKYAMAEDMTEENLKLFLQAVLDGKAQPAYKSEPIPSDEEVAKSSVLKVVQKSFAKEVADAETDVLLEMHTDWGPKHKELVPVLELAADVLKQSGSTIRFAHMDSTKNAELKDMYNDKWSYEKYDDFSLFFVKKGGVTEPIKSSLATDPLPSAKEILSFAHTHATEPFDLQALNDKLDELVKAAEEKKKADEAASAEEKEELDAWNNPDSSSEPKAPEATEAEAKVEL